MRNNTRNDHKDAFFLFAWRGSARREVSILDDAPSPLRTMLSCTPTSLFSPSTPSIPATWTTRSGSPGASPAGQCAWPSQILRPTFRSEAPRTSRPANRARRSTAGARPPCLCCRVRSPRTRRTLTAGVPRSAVLIDLELDQAGQHARTRPSLGEITVVQRLSYKDVPSIACDRSHPHHQAMVNAIAIARGFLKQRRARGALAFLDQQQMLLTDEEGRVQHFYSLRTGSLGSHSQDKEIPCLLDHGSMFRDSRRTGPGLRTRRHAAHVTMREDRQNAVRPGRGSANCPGSNRVGRLAAGPAAFRLCCAH